MKNLSPTLGFPAWGLIRLGNPRESDFGGHQNWVEGLPEDWGKHRLNPWRLKKNNLVHTQPLDAKKQSCVHKDQEKSSTDPVGD